MENNISKHQIRNKIRQKRETLSKDFVQTSSKIIHDFLFSLTQYKQAKMIMPYIAFNNEVETLPIIENAFQNGKSICVSQIIKENKTIIPLKIKSVQDIDFSIKIPQPKNGEICNIEDMDISIIPGIAFDIYGNRIGFGAGYYDKFLSNFKKIKIAIAFDFQVLEEKIPVYPYDIPMDIIITEKRIIKLNSL
jgi:5-formyltetrahydrofolate cyclo-ligase